MWPACAPELSAAPGTPRERRRTGQGRGRTRGVRARGARAPLAQVIELRPVADRFLRLLEILGQWYEKGKVLIFVKGQGECDDLFRDLLKARRPPSRYRVRNPKPNPNPAPPASAASAGTGHPSGECVVCPARGKVSCSCARACARAESRAQRVRRAVAVPDRLVRLGARSASVMCQHCRGLPRTGSPGSPVPGGAGQSHAVAL
jgi:hypothetical protein